MGKEHVCKACGVDRVRRWEQMRAANGLTEEEWPRPEPPRFRSRVELAIHKVRKHTKGQER